MKSGNNLFGTLYKAYVEIINKFHIYEIEPNAEVWLFLRGFKIVPEVFI